ncbi:neutral/alkaline non-lysosomal ceramidase N-terminal domain-containing protein [Roseovarius pacificus]|uniref:neutral/alkaline non-lysosomal ceramidase N-terminal domain-containing protein n=1 Tax=Roseovarius pacificus TaxID=337701 RepID=UPI002A18BFC0|nr:neutral/alkaline non-lysosomal ceramidase N-terminal domain-containing protein [Roseovarius pacificus]
MKSLVAMVALSLLAATAHAGNLRIGAGRAVITPAEPMWMAGYASRAEPSSGKLHDLWTKALVFDDGSGVLAAIVTTDLIGISARVAAATAARAESELGIPRERLMITASHTHSGPVARDNLIGMYALDEEQERRIDAFTAALPEHILDALQQAVDTLAPGTLGWGIGHTDFAKNRREYTPNGVINRFNPIGPVDHDVPVLAARNKDGGLVALLFGYACHNTVLSGQELCGDYAGFAQLHLEEAFPGTTALYVEGCGGDQNPLPRRSVALAQLYGDMLGRAVRDVVAGEMTAVDGPITAAYEEIPLPLSPAPSRAELEAQLQDANIYKQRLAKALLKTLDEKGALAETYPYPVQVWRFGSGLQMTALGGEAVADYALRIKTEFPAERQFVIAYANDVCSYIPSLRVLREGGYEGCDSMVYYGFHGPWAAPVETDILACVRHLAGKRAPIDLSNAEATAAHRPLLIAHRGGAVGESTPACSEAAIAAAAIAGYDLVELDLRESKDGEPIVFHDKALAPAVDAVGSVADHTALELAALRFAGTSEPILHFEQAAARCKQEGLGIMLDIKAGQSDDFFRRVIGVLERFELKPASCCINGAPEIREHLAGHVMLTHRDGEAEGGRTFWFGQASQLTADHAKALQAEGILVIPAINTFRYDSATHAEDARNDAERLLDAGVDGFQIDSVYGDYFAQQK